MPSAVKEKFVDSLSQELKTSAHVVVSEYQGMTAVEFDELRASLAPQGAKFKVVKNRLAKRALENSGFSELKEYLKGPSAITYLGSDAAGISKILLKFSETHTNLKVRGGRLLGTTADFKTLKALANLPSREVLLATLLARLNSPLIQLASTLNSPLQKLHTALNALAKKKETAPAA
jgi:large subunit ribosomal protein L10